MILGSPTGLIVRLRVRFGHSAMNRFMERPAAGHSGLSPANFTTLAHFSVSSAMNFPKSAGEPDNAVPPRSARRALNLGSARAALISRLSLLTISAGVFFGVPTPLQKLDS